MTVTSIAAESHVLRCLICARPAPRGTRLCAQCHAAVKRARQVPSLPSGILPQAVAMADAAGPPGGADRRTTPARRAGGVGMPSVPGGWGTYATLIAFGVAVSATGYFAMDRQDETAHRAGVAPVAGTASGAGVHGEAAGPPPLPAMAKGAPGEEIIARIEWTVPAAPPARNPGELPGRKPARDVGSGNQGLKPATGDGPMPKSIDARPAGGEAHPASGVDRAAIAVVSTAPAPEVQAPAIRDRWHVLAAALARCEREDVLVAFVCRERARLQYCEGHWGTAPQCPTVALGSNAR